LSAAVGAAAAVALVRGLTRCGTDRVGNLWVDVTRTCTRVLSPLAVVGGVVLLAMGVVQDLHPAMTVPTLTGGSQSVITGPVATWEPLKLLTGDGGGAFNVNSAHPFENPSPIGNVIEIVMMLLIPQPSRGRTGAWSATAARAGPSPRWWPCC